MALEVTLEEIERAQKWHSLNRISQLFPETGELSRHKYPKHVAFMNAGATHMERLMIAGNRCITPWTPVEMDHATRHCGELIGETGFDVRSWDGGSRCTRKAYPVFLRGIERAFLLRLDNGQELQCSGRHRVLTPEGWTSVYRIIQRAGGLHCRRIGQSLTANCDADDRPYDGQPPSLSGSGLSRLPSPERVQTRGRIDGLVDGAERIFERTRVFQAFGHHSIQDEGYRLADLCGLFSDPTSSISALWPTQNIQEIRRSARESCRSQQVRGSGRHSRFAASPAAERKCSGGAGIPEEESPEDSSFSLPPSVKALGFSGQGFLRSALHTEIFVPFEPRLLYGGNSIVAVVDIGYQPIVDFEVLGTHCYESGGAISHNCGKSETAAYEITLHLTGDYPHWWQGRRFAKAPNIWVAGVTSETTRDIIQVKLLGSLERKPGSAEKVGIGTGLIPADKIIAHSPKAGVPGAVGECWVRHASGGASSLGFKSFGVDSSGKPAENWLGVKREAIWLDEESNEATYHEALARLMATVPGEENGIMLMTFTPLQGYTSVVKHFLESNDPDVYVEQVAWRDCAHLSARVVEQLSKKFLPSQLKARSEGIPAIGEGAIYPIDIDEISVDPFRIPDTWPKCFGMDVGKTAVVWLAWDKDADVVYAWDEYFSTAYDTVLHVEAIKARGPWPGVIDPSSLQSNQMDGQKLFDIYKAKGLDVQWERTGVESGLTEVWQRLSTGRLKFFKHLSGLRMEFQRYHRIKSETVFGVQDKIVKKDDHRVDALRYAIVSGLKRARTGLPKPPESRSIFEAGSFASGGGSWQVM